MKCTHLLYTSIYTKSRHQIEFLGMPEWLSQLSYDSWYWLTMKPAWNSLSLSLCSSPLALTLSLQRKKKYIYIYWGFQYQKTLSRESQTKVNFWVDLSCQSHYILYGKNIKQNIHTKCITDRCSTQGVHISKSTTLKNFWTCARCCSAIIHELTHLILSQADLWGGHCYYLHLLRRKPRHKAFSSFSTIVRQWHSQE